MTAASRPSIIGGMVQPRSFLLLFLLAFCLSVASCGEEEAPTNGTEPGNGDEPEDTEDPCTFNEDCIDEERCECDLHEGCFCRVGPRGEGRSGVDTCEDGNDCETALCVEGPEDVYYCSGPCSGPEDCGPALPICSNIAFLGQICIRDPES